MDGVISKTNKISMNNWISTPRVTELLDALYADSATNDPLALKTAQERPALNERGNGLYEKMKKGYMAVGPDFGRLLYSLARTTKAKTVVEFGTSFGISTIFLASAMRDNGGGKVVTTEFHPEKAERAKKNLAAAGLEEWVEFRVGDALDTLSAPPREIDMVFLDGAKELYLDILRLLEPHLRSGGIVASDNTDRDGIESFLNYIRTTQPTGTPQPRFSLVQRGKAHEITVRN
jgi:predicted O-methyltransferase YrrM